MGMDVEYDLEALKKGLLKIDKQIEIFEDAIRREMDRKIEYRHMIDVLEAKKNGKG